MSARPRIALIATGGTISGVADARSDFDSGRDAQAIGIDVVPSRLAEIRMVDFARVPSRAMTPQMMRELAVAVTAEVETGCEGLVITHGTDTMEETVYALALMLERTVPVAVTGAMRHPGHAGYDGDANLRAAVAVASDPDAGPLGPLVVFGEEMHLARWVAKVHTSRPSPFASPGFGPVGRVTEGRPHFAVPSAPSDFLGLPERLDGHSVELIWIAAGTSDLLVHAAARYAQAIVVAGTGGGHVPPAIAAAIEQVIDAGVPVVLASRCGAGPILADTYRGEGSEQHLRSVGVVPAGDLAPLKARLRLQVALALGRSADSAFPVSAVQ
jgi:L-asparaginase